MRRSPVAVALVTLVARTALANDTNYQNYVVGDRALGLGGAFTALGDDGSGPYYNPAGCAFLAASSASLSLSVYGFERRRVKHGYTAKLDGQSVALDFDQESMATLPTTAAAVYKVGAKGSEGTARGAVGLATFLRYSDNHSVDAVLAGPRSHGAFSMTESDKTLWVGPFAAYRLTERFAVGLAAFYSDRSVRRARSSLRGPAPRALARRRRRDLAELGRVR